MSETQSFPEWKNLQGTTLEGGYELKEIVEAAQDHAVLRVRVLGDYTLRANAVFYLLEAAKADDQVGLWQTVRDFEQKTNVSVPLGIGILTLNGASVAYLVFQNPDETLKEVLASRPLSPEETTDVLRSAATGLGELHAYGLVHGSVSPEEVLAIGDAIDISTEGIRRVNAEPVVERKSAQYLAPESGTRNLTIASDVWCLGATVFEALTQKTYAPGLQGEAAALKHPFGRLLACCLEPNPDKRCKLGDLEAILRSKASAAVQPTPVTVPEKQVVKPTAAGSVGALPTKTSEASSGVVPTVAPRGVAITETMAAMASTETVQRPVRSDAKPGESAIFDQETKPEAIPNGKSPNEPTADRKLPNELDSLRPIRRNEPSTPVEEGGIGLFSGRRGWIYAVAAFLVIFFIFWAVRSREKPASATVAGNKSTSTNTGTAWPTKTLAPETKTAPANSEPRAAAVPTSSAPVMAEQGRTIWRVVLYTYNRQQDAESKAHAISGNRPDLGVQVFSPSGSGAPYLVVAGGQMNREEAMRIRQRAINEGMPQDSYIQNYSR